ncbi:MAG: hypothetical protein WBX25_04105 [Rhodomicrobium sp.]
MRRRKKIAHAAMISATPVELEIMLAVPGASVGIKDSPHMVSTVAGIEPAASSAATFQSTMRRAGIHP